MIAVCKDSYVDLRLWFWPSGKMIGIKWESMRITIITVILRHMSFDCWLWTIEEVRPNCFYVILHNSWGAHEPLWNDSRVILGVILSDLWTTPSGCVFISLTFLKWFWGNSWWFSVIHWNDSGVILCGLQTILKWFWGIIENPHKSYIGKRGWANLPEYIRFIRMQEDSLVMHIESKDSHWNADSI